MGNVELRKWAVHQDHRFKDTELSEMVTYRTNQFWW